MPIPLQNDVIYGPIHSRRLGCSLGINLLSLSRKICTFDCLYCQYGFTRDPHREFIGKSIPFHSPDTVEEAIREKLQNKNTLACEPDSVTFAGNGEPTLHPNLGEIIERVETLRREYAPEAILTILSNSGLVHVKKVRNALMRLDRRIMKLDGGSAEIIEKINRPFKKLDFPRMIEGLKQIRPLMIQSFFLEGINTGKKEVADWIYCLAQIKPEFVQIYSIDRPPADINVIRPTHEKLVEIAGKVRNELNIKTSVYS